MPLSHEILKAPWILIIILFWLIGLGLGSLGLGRWLLRRLGLTDLRPGAEITLGLGLGVALLSYMVFLLAACHLLSIPSLCLLSGLWIGGLSLHFFLPGSTLPRRYPTQEIIFSPGSLWLMLLAVFGALNLLGALTPAIDWDGLAYHLALPKIYLSQGGFVFRPDIFHNLFPQFAEMLYTLGLLFPYGIAPKIMHWGFGLLAALALYQTLRFNYSLAWARWGALIFYAQYLVHIESGTAFIDLVATAYLALALLAFQATRQLATSSRGRYLVIFLVGLTAAVKWHGLIWLGLTLVMMIWSLAQERSVRLKTIGGLLFWGCLPVLPYLLRAWIMGGNPIWPLGYACFGGKAWNLAIAQQVAEIHQTFAGISHDWLGLLRLPYDLLVQGKAFGVGGQELRFPLLATGLLGVTWISLRGREVWQKTNGLIQQQWIGWGVVGLVYLLIWFKSSQQIRFLLPAFPLLAYLALRALADLWHTGGYVRKLLVIISGTLFFIFHPPLHHSTLEQVRVSIGLVPAETYISQELPHFRATQFLNQVVLPGERVLLLGENRGFYLEGDYLWGDPMLQVVIDYDALKTPEQLWAKLQDLQVKWILFRTDLYGEDYLPPGVIQRVQSLLDLYGDLQYTYRAIRVYRLKEKPASHFAGL